MCARSPMTEITQVPNLRHGEIGPAKCVMSLQMFPSTKALKFRILQRDVARTHKSLHASRTQHSSVDTRLFRLATGAFPSCENGADNIMVTKVCYPLSSNPSNFDPRIVFSDAKSSFRSCFFFEIEFVAQIHSRGWETRSRTSVELAVAGAFVVTSVSTWLSIPSSALTHSFKPTKLHTDCM